MLGSFATCVILSLSLMQNGKYGWFSPPNTSDDAMASQTPALKSQSQTPAADRHVCAAMLCVRNYSYLTEESVFACPWRRAVMDGGRQAEGWCGDTAVEGGWAPASETAAICIPLSSVAGWERWGGTGVKLWQNCGRGTGIKEAALLDLNISSHCLASVGKHAERLK